jgi:hypothetical protein
VIFSRRHADDGVQLEIRASESHTELGGFGGDALAPVPGQKGEPDLDVIDSIGREPAKYYSANPATALDFTKHPDTESMLAPVGQVAGDVSRCLLFIADPSKPCHGLSILMKLQQTEEVLGREPLSMETRGLERFRDTQVSTSSGHIQDFAPIERSVSRSIAHRTMQPRFDRDSSLAGPYWKTEDEAHSEIPWRLK